ncbi:MAG: Asp-tRNA(Asn)/Glu-tRNA(Gln) amidotransferase GatCAB subunit B [Gemmatimonadetes bacterium]|nr:MAG: Asp-tRNA(Asn)/Glu-tRNA(Gln) amidotransferase GatCAB subunit B [Gemmatimonadota bacterium]
MSHGRYEMVVGLEVHVQLRTRTKVFCRCSTQFGDPPNQNTCPVCLALPGALPVLNGRAVEFAVRSGLALGCAIRERSVFARKNYFYPDLPKGYQISQFEMPLCEHGSVALASGRTIGITRIHMEEDAGKSVHDRFAGYTAIDLNRSGVPLIEIVSEPELSSSAEAGAYLRAVKEILLYAGVSDCSMEEGSLRVDANVSARRHGEQALRTRTEIKNLNAFSNVERALEIEFARHCAVHDAGGAVVQQTMLYDADRNTVRPARSKEASHDYRYFPDPDLPPLVLSRAYIEGIRATLPEFPSARRVRYRTDFAVSAVEADLLTAEPSLGDYFEVVARGSGDSRAAAHWVMGEVLAARNAAGAETGIPVPAEALAELIRMVKAGTVSNTAAKTIYATLVAEGGAARLIAERDGLLLVGDETSLRGWVDDVFKENPDEAARFIGGERRLQGVLIGLVMKKSQGSADPQKLSQLIGERVGR